MTKSELIEQMAITSGESKKTVSNVLNAFTDTIQQTLKHGEYVDIHGFGRFSATKKPPRTARNPKTGQTVQVAAKRSPKFTFSATVKKNVNN